MRIQSKISLTFVLLLIFGVTAVSSYAIMFIRDYLLKEGQQTIQDHALWLSATMVEHIGSGNLDSRMEEISKISGYEMMLFDESGQIVAMHPVQEANGLRLDAAIFDSVQSNTTYLVNLRENDKLYVYTQVSGDEGLSGILRVAREKARIYEPIATIRWIIYTGMFISIGVILLVSNMFSRYLARPILELKEAAQRIAEGKVDKVVVSDRSDEFGDLAGSINSMAIRLKQDNERLSQINEKQSRFFADITHEIRNPLHTIMTSMELLETGVPDPEKQRKYIQNARSQADRISSLFKDLLTLQRYDSDENFIQMQWFDLSRITSRVAELYEEEAQKKGISLNIQTTPCRVLADAAKIEQVIDNLISNALKYTSKGEVGLTYEVIEKKATVTVFDTGIGISSEHISNLFDRFYRTDKARSRDQGGTGLGLAVVKSIMDAHGAEVLVNSEVGKGSSFSFSLNAK